MIVIADIVIGILKLLIAILVFGLIIFVHELGHFLVAKLMGVKVNEFALGMGPRLLSFGRGETTYSLRLLPIGGFCSMEGEDAAGAGEVKLSTEPETAEAVQTAEAPPEDTPDLPAEPPETAPAVSRDPRAYCNKRVWRRVLIVVAGATMNLILGFALMLLYFGVVMQPDPGHDRVVFTTTTVAKFYDNASSQATGLRVGDTIRSINGKAVLSGFDMSYFLQNDEDGVFDMVVSRQVDGKAQRVTLKNVTFEIRKNEQTGAQQLIYDFYVLPQEKTFVAVVEQAARMEGSIGMLVWNSLGDMLTGRVGINQLSGPVGVVDAIGDAALPADPDASGGWSIEIDWETLIMMMTMITVNVGIFNLLPLPALDGGRLIFLAFEGIFRRPIPAKYEGMVHAIGMILLLALVLFVTFFDIRRLIFGA